MKYLLVINSLLIACLDIKYHLIPIPLIVTFALLVLYGIYTSAITINLLPFIYISCLTAIIRLSARFMVQTADVILLFLSGLLVRDQELVRFMHILALFSLIIAGTWKLLYRTNRFPLGASICLSLSANLLLA